MELPDGGANSSDSGQPPITAESVPQPVRVKAFANFFKNYMSLWSVVTAALPIPVTFLGLIPTFSSQKGFLSTYTSLFCFLLLGFLFYSRHALARGFFPDAIRLYAMSPGSSGPPVRRLRPERLLALLPLVLILASLGFVFEYHSLLDNAVIQLEKPVQAEQLRAAILDKTEANNIPGSNRIALSYLLIFLTAESAFILMAIREYLQDLLHLTEEALIYGYSPKKA